MNKNYMNFKKSQKTNGHFFSQIFKKNHINKMTYFDDKI